MSGQRGQAELDGQGQIALVELDRQAYWLVGQLGYLERSNWLDRQGQIFLSGQILIERQIGKVREYLVELDITSIEGRRLCPFLMAPPLSSIIEIDFTFVRLQIDMRMYICTNVCMYVYICMYVCMCVCIYVRMQVCVYKCMHAQMYVCMHARNVLVGLRLFLSHVFL